MVLVALALVALGTGLIHGGAAGYDAGGSIPSLRRRGEPRQRAGRCARTSLRSYRKRRARRRGRAWTRPRLEQVELPQQVSRGAAGPASRGPVTWEDTTRRRMALGESRLTLKSSQMAERQVSPSVAQSSYRLEAAVRRALRLNQHSRSSFQRSPTEDGCSGMRYRQNLQ